MKAYLILANGLVMEGKSVGVPGTTIGEVVFTTGMVGFEETLTDPSNYGLIVTQTYPLVGNYGMNKEDMVSDRIWCRGYVVREACDHPSNFRSEMTLDEFLKEQNTIGIQGIDTRRLTRILRDQGAMNGAITTEVDPADEAALAALMEKIKAYSITGALEAVASKAAYEVNPEGEPHVAVLDFGCCGDAVRCLEMRGCHVSVLPYDATVEDLKELNADGLMLTTGPGDPAENTQVIGNVRAMLDTGIAAYGVGLGHELAALAAGAKTVKMKHGHRGANQPVTDYKLDRNFITTQNHGYVVDSETLPAEAGKVSHVNTNDGTCQGIVYSKWNCETVQFHPENLGGPREVSFMLDNFVDRVKKSKEANKNA